MTMRGLEFSYGQLRGSAACQIVRNVVTQMLHIIYLNCLKKRRQKNMLLKISSFIAVQSNLTTLQPCPVS